MKEYLEMFLTDYYKRKVDVERITKIGDRINVKAKLSPGTYKLDIKIDIESQKLEEENRSC